MGIEALPEQPVTTVTTQDTGTLPAMSPTLKYGLIGVGVLSVAGLLYYALRGKKTVRHERVYQNPIERYKPDYKVVNDIKDKFITLHKSGISGLGAFGLNFIDDLQYYGFTRKDATKTVQAALSKAWDEIYHSNPSGTMKLYASKYEDPKYRLDSYKGTIASEYYHRGTSKIMDAMKKAGRLLEQQGYHYKARTDKNGDIIIDYWKEAEAPQEGKPVNWREVLLGKEEDSELHKQLQKKFEKQEPIKQVYTLRTIQSAPNNIKYEWFMSAARTARSMGAYGDAQRFKRMANKASRMIHTNPLNPKGVKVFTDFHGFEPTKLKEVTVPIGYPDELVLIGKAHQVRYESNKINGAPDDDGTNKLYKHDLDKGSLWATDIHGKGLYLIDPKLEVRPEGLVH